MKNCDNSTSQLIAKVSRTKKLDLSDTSTSNQHKIIISALKVKPQSTIDLRHFYGIMQPAPRIKELRDMGLQIDTVRVNEATPDNIKHHSVAKYVLHKCEALGTLNDSEVTV